MNSLVAWILVAVCTGEVLSSQYHGPIAFPHVLHDGHIADTHEVAAAKAEHYAAVAKAKAYTPSNGYHGDDGLYAGGYADHESSSNYGGNCGYNHGQEHVYSHDDHGHLRYHGPTAIPHVLHDGHIADTDEVAAAKAEHYSAVSHAKAHTPSHGYHGDDSRYAGGYAGHNGYEGSANYGGNYGYNNGHERVYSHDDHGHLRYHGPIAIPHVLHDGHISDTHEVAAAKAEHYAAVAKAKAHGGYGHGYSGQYATGYGGYHGYSHHAATYHGPLANGAAPYSGY